MENSIYIALSRQAAMRREMDVAANNIANVDTPGFRGERVIFQEYISAPNFRERHSFVDDVGTARDTTLGAFETTGNQFDLALSNKDNFFVVETPMGERYTRHGKFHLDVNGDLVTGSGYPVMGEGRNIEIPPEVSSITITGDGAVLDDAAGGIEIDRLRVVSIADPTILKRAADSMYILDPDQTAEVAEEPGVIQGVLEDSNVKAIRELTRIMEISRMYEAITNFGKKEDERIGQMISELGKTPS
ncbi:MAG: flagellar basal-body rod protein FlgF [Alphaproteobacteria bacterium]